MTLETAHATCRRYVYAIIRQQDVAAIQSTNLLGLYDAPIRIDIADDLAIVSSAIDAETIRPRRQLLTAHQNVVAQISRQWDMLPVAFGLIANDDTELTAILLANSSDLNEAIARVSGKVEMNLVLSWTVENVYHFIVSKHPELQEARDQVAAGQANREEMIELGRRFDQLMQAERASHAEAISQALANVCHDILVQDPKSEKEIVRTQCLIHRDSEQAFNDAVHQLADKYDSNYGFAFNGPWPPYSFVQLTLSTQ